MNRAVMCLLLLLAARTFVRAGDESYASYHKYDSLGENSYFHSDYRAAFDAWQQAYTLAGKLGNCRLSNRSLINLARVRYGLGEKKEALAELKAVNDALKQCPDDSAAFNCDYYRGVIWFEIREVDSALGMIQRCLSTPRTWLSDARRSKLYSVRGEILWAGYGDSLAGLKDFETALQLAEQSGDLNSIAFAHLKLGSTRATGDFHLRHAHLQTALSLWDSSGSLVDVIYARRLLAQLYSQYGMARETYQAYDLLWALQDTLFKREMRMEMADLRARFETQQIANQKLGLERDLAASEANILYISLLFSVAVLIGIIVFLLLRRQAQRRRHQLEADLQAAEKRHYLEVIQAQESERSKLAANLHDGVGQLLVALRLGISGRAAPNGDDQRLLSLVDESAREVRTISHTLMPGALQKAGLYAALRDLELQFNHDGQERISVVTEEDLPQLPPNSQIHLFRIIQELIANAFRHGKANWVQILLEKRPEGLFILVEDDGTGTELRKLETGSGSGWNNIRGRLQALGATATPLSVAGQGLTVEILVPLQG
ncbi:MAG: hypothetical protein H6581_25460 [Bacteroidia bacterium]|nr:hypothetical protein [Bacteroidia bacterium]